MNGAFSSIWWLWIFNLMVICIDMLIFVITIWMIKTICLQRIFPYVFFICLQMRWVVLIPSQILYCFLVIVLILNVIYILFVIRDDLALGFNMPFVITIDCLTLRFHLFFITKLRNLYRLSSFIIGLFILLKLQFTLLKVIWLVDKRLRYIRIVLIINAVSYTHLTLPTKRIV